MARIRSIHPGLFSDEAFVDCSMPARLLQIGLWTEADDKGVFEWKPLTIKMKVFPADTFTRKEMEGQLSELEAGNIISRFEHEGRVYGAIRNFRRFQRPKKPNDVHPLPPDLRSYVGLADDSSVPVGNSFGTAGEILQQMEDGGWRREDGGGNNNPHIQGKTSLLGNTRASFVDSDGVIHDEEEFEVAQ